MNQTSNYRRSWWRAILLIVSLVSCGAAVWAQVATNAGGKDARAPKTAAGKSGSAKNAENDAYDFNIPHFKDNLLRSKILGRNAVTHGDITTLKQVRVETYVYVNGKPKVDLIAESPSCVYDMSKKVSTSTEAIAARKSDGSLSISGTGFEFRQIDNHLIISNHCLTTIQIRQNPAPGPKP
jgi:hypothetical protein